MENKNLTLLSIIVFVLIGFVAMNSSNQRFPRAQTQTLPPLCDSFTGNPCLATEVCVRYPVQGTAPQPNDTRSFRCVNVSDAYSPSGFGLGNNQQQSQQNQSSPFAPVTPYGFNILNPLYYSIMNNSSAPFSYSPPTTPQPYINPLFQATPSFVYDSFGQLTLPYNTESPVSPELEELQYLFGQPAVTPDPLFNVQQIISAIRFGSSALDDAVEAVTSGSSGSSDDGDSGSGEDADQRSDNTQNITSLNRSSLPNNFVALSTSGFVSPCRLRGGFENRDGSQRGCEPIKCADGQEFPTCLFNGLPVLSCPNNTNAGIGYCSCEDLNCYPINY